MITVFRSLNKSAAVTADELIRLRNAGVQLHKAGFFAFFFFPPKVPINFVLLQLLQFTLVWLFIEN